MRRRPSYRVLRFLPSPRARRRVRSALPATRYWERLTEHGVRVQVVCPEVVRTEFHTRQGMDLSQVLRMEPDQVVEASLADLDAGVIVSIPGLTELTAIDCYDTAGRALVAVAQATELSSRYTG